MHGGTRYDGRDSRPSAPRRLRPPIDARPAGSVWRIVPASRLPSQRGGQAALWIDRIPTGRRLDASATPSCVLRWSAWPARAAKAGLPTAGGFGAVCVAARRTIGMRPFECNWRRRGVPGGVGRLAWPRARRVPFLPAPNALPGGGVHSHGHTPWPPRRRWNGPAVAASLSVASSRAMEDVGAPGYRSDSPTTARVRLRFLRDRLRAQARTPPRRLLAFWSTEPRAARRPRIQRGHCFALVDEATTSSSTTRTRSSSPARRAPPPGGTGRSTCGPPCGRGLAAASTSASTAAAGPELTRRPKAVAGPPALRPERPAMTELLERRTALHAPPPEARSALLFEATGRDRRRRRAAHAGRMRTPAQAVEAKEGCHHLVPTPRPVLSDYFRSTPSCRMTHRSRNAADCSALTGCASSACDTSVRREQAGPRLSDRGAKFRAFAAEVVRLRALAAVLIGTRSDPTGSGASPGPRHQLAPQLWRRVEDWFRPASLASAEGSDRSTLRVPITRAGPGRAAPLGGDGAELGRLGRKTRSGQCSRRTGWLVGTRTTRSR